MNYLYKNLKGILILMLSVVSINSMAEEDFPSVRGAKSEKELSQFVFNAIKYNDLSMLNNYVPSQQEIDYLISTSTKRNKPFFENLTVDKVNATNQQNFQYIIKEGIEKGVNWSTIELRDYQTRSCDIENIGCNVFFSIQDSNGNVMSFSYNAIKVKNSWFLFPGIKVETSKLGRL